MADADSFGDASEVLLQQEAKLSQLAEEKRALAEENRVLGAAVEALEQRLKAAQRRATEAEARAEAEALAARRQRAAAAAADEERQLGLEKHRHRTNNDRILLEQAERGRRDAEAQLSAARQQAAALAADKADLQQRLAGAQRQQHKLEELQPFQEQQRGNVATAAALARANARVRQLEGRCAELEAELGSTAAALAAAQELVNSRSAAEGRPQDEQQQQQQQQRGPDSLSLSDLCDLGGAASQFVGAAASSPQRSALSGVAGGGPGGLPSRRRALQQRQADQQVQSRQQDQGERGKQRGAPAQQQPLERHEAAVAEALAIAEREPHTSPSLVESLQQQLLEQQRQLAHLQLQQQAALQDRSAGAGADRQTAAEAELSSRLQAVQGELEKLQRRNLQLQAALAESSLQHARAAATAQQQLQVAQAEVAALRARRDEAQQQLALLQAAAAVLAGEGEEGEQLGSSGGGAGPSAEQLEELLEYASRCNAAVEQNAALLQEKKGCLEKLQAAEAVAERCRSETAQLRLQQAQVGPSGTTSGSGMGQQAPQGRHAQQQQGREEQLLQQLLEAQAAEAALRSVLSEAREEQVAACKALSSELRRVHALERLRISDMAEVQRLQRRLHELHRECRQLCKALAAAQQQLAACGKRPGPAWAAAAAAVEQRQGAAAGGGMSRVAPSLAAASGLA